MKKIIMLIVIATILLFAGCANTSQTSKPKLDHFVFSWSNEKQMPPDSQYYDSYTLYKKDGETFLYADSLNNYADNVDLGNAIRVDNSTLDDIEAIIKKYDMSNWETFEDLDILHAPSFNLAIGYGDDIKVIYYYGLLGDYEDGVEELHTYLIGLVEKHAQ